MSHGIIAIISDFGASDYFTGVMKGVIKSINPAADIVDITSGVVPFSIVNAQFILASTYRHFPAGTVFLTVIDPGVGSARKALAAYDGTYHYVLPDNDIISAVASATLECHEIVPSSVESISSTFHGRDIFAPAAAKLSLGESPDGLGPRVEKPMDEPYPPFTKNPTGICGRILHVDTFGNIITSVPGSMIDEMPDMRILIGGKPLKIKVVSHYDELDEGETGLYHGSAGFLGLALKRDSLARRLGIAPGDPVTGTYND